MKISHFSIIVISIVALAISAYGVIVLTSPSAISSQNDRIYLHSSNSPGSSGNYVRISDMVPNSFEYFIYPSSHDLDNANASQKFMLIRLPKILGGDKNDTSSYRAYSALDPTSHCLIKYWPENGRQRIEDSCTSPPYRSIDGVSYSPWLAISRGIATGALPKLDLDVDSQGYLVVKPPAWEENKNGVVGIGRDISKDEVVNSSQYMLEKFATQFKTSIPIPLFLEDGSLLIDMASNSANDTYFRYTWDRSNNNTPIIDTVYCNCTGLSPNDPDYDRMTKYMQAWQFGNHTVYASATNVDGKPNPSAFYPSFEFYSNGYHVFFNSASSFDQGMKTILDTFFNGTELSDIEKSR